MVNPDGVIMGNYRTGFGGRDLNRRFTAFGNFLFPTVVAIRNIIFELKKKYGKNVLAFIDFHGHSI